MWDDTEPSSILEQDIFQILEPNKVKDVEALYKTSKQRFVLVFGSEDSASQCRRTELSKMLTCKVSALRESRKNNFLPNFRTVRFNSIL